MTDLVFEKATPVKLVGAGRVAEPNPYLDAVKSIAGQTEDGKPAALAFTMTYDAKAEDGFKVAYAKVSRQLTEAGKACEPAVTVRKATVSDGKGSVRITFWTVEKITRTAKPAAK